MKKLIEILTGIIIVVASYEAFADTFYYHRSSSIELGKPYDSFSPEENLSGSGLFEFSENGSTQGEGVNEVYFNYSEISSASEISKALSIDANAEAKFAFGSGQISAQYSKISEKSSNEIIIAVTAYKEYKPRKKNGRLSLTEDAKTLLAQAKDSKQLHLWRKIAGSDVIMETTSGHSLTLFYHFATASSSKLAQIRSGVSAEWSSGSASADLVKAARSIDETVSVKVDYYQVGGDASVNVLESILSTNNGNVLAVKKALKLALQGGTKNNARILRFNTQRVGTLADVVFGTGGAYGTLEKYYSQVLAARQTHFDRSLITLRRLNQTQRLLDEKPDQSYSIGGKNKLENMKSSLRKVYNDILAEYEKYQTLNPSEGKISTFAGVNIPTLSPTIYFKSPFVKPSTWVRTNGSAHHCGWATYKDCGFHDFYVDFYPRIQFILPEFVQRMRIWQNCVPKAAISRSDFSKIVASGGSLFNHFKTSHSAIKAWTFGTNAMPGAFNNWKVQVGKQESKKKYILEIVTTDEEIQYVDLGAYGKPGGKVTTIKDECGA